MSKYDDWRERLNEIDFIEMKKLRPVDIEVIIMKKAGYTFQQIGDWNDITREASRRRLFKALYNYRLRDVRDFRNDKRYSCNV